MADDEHSRGKRWTRVSLAQLVLAAAALTPLSIVVVVYGASEEPFFRFDWLQFAIVVVGAALLVLAWVLWLVAFWVSGQARRHAAVFAPLGLWALICIFYLQFSVTGYFDDLVQFEYLRRGHGARALPAMTLAGAG